MRVLSQRRDSLAGSGRVPTHTDVCRPIPVLQQLMSRALNANDDISSIYGATALGVALLERQYVVLLLQEKLHALGGRQKQHAHDVQVDARGGGADNTPCAARAGKKTKKHFAVHDIYCSQAPIPNHICALFPHETVEARKAQTCGTQPLRFIRT